MSRYAFRAAALIFIGMAVGTALAVFAEQLSAPVGAREAVPFLARIVTGYLRAMTFALIAAAICGAGRLTDGNR